MTSESLPIKAPPLRGLTRQERQFLPAALEIVETPPSPIGRLGGYVLVFVFASAIVWAYLGHVDIVAIAKGKIIPTGYTKIIQPFETGVLRAIHVQDGQKVHTGDVLIELDPTMNKAELGHLEGDLMAARIDVARLTAALKAEIGGTVNFVAPEGATLEQAEMGRQFFLGQFAQYKRKLASLIGGETLKQAERESLRASIGKIQALLPMMQERTQMRKTLLDHQNGSKIVYLESLQELVSNQKDLDVQTSHLKEADAALAEASAKREEMQADYRRANLSDLAEATRKAGGLEQDVARAKQRTRYQALTAPIDGTRPAGRGPHHRRRRDAGSDSAGDRALRQPDGNRGFGRQRGHWLHPPRPSRRNQSRYVQLYPIRPAPRNRHQPLARCDRARSRQQKHR